MQASSLHKNKLKEKTLRTLSRKCRHENALRARERIGFYAVFYRTPEMEQTVDRDPRPRHSAQTRRVARLRINLIISATKSSWYAEEIHKEARGRLADRVDTSRDNGDYREEHSVFPPSLPPPTPSDGFGGERGSIGLSHFRDPISRLDAGPTYSLAIHEPLVRTILPPAASIAADSFPFGSDQGGGGCRHAATQQHFRNCSLSFSACIGILSVLSEIRSILYPASLMCTLESDWMRGGGTPSRRWMRQRRRRGREREVTLSLVAPNKATLAFQDERQVYRREFMRAELQRWSSWGSVCKGRKSHEESGKKIRGRVEGRKGTEWVESIQVDWSRVRASSRVVVRGKLCPFSSRGDPSTGAISAGTGEFCARSWRRQRRRRIIPRRKVPRYRRPAPSSQESLWNNERAGQIDETGERRISRKYQDIIDFSRPSLGL